MAGVGDAWAVKRRSVRQYVNQLCYGFKMLKRTLALIQFLKALSAWERDDLTTCLVHLHRAEKLRQFTPFKMAFKAQLLIAIREYEEANAIISASLSALKTPRNANERYVQIVCLLWQKEHFRDVTDANSLWAEALALECSPNFRRFLLLRQPPEFTLPKL